MKLNILHKRTEKKVKVPMHCPVHISKDFIKIHESKSYACTTVIYCMSVPAQLSKNGKKKKPGKLHATRKHTTVYPNAILYPKKNSAKKS